MGLTIAGFVVVCTLVAVFVGAKIVQQGKCLVIERLGSYRKTLGSGFQWLWPFFEAPRPMYWVENGIVTLRKDIDLRETVLDVPEQDVITKDNVSIRIDALLYVQIMNPVKALYEIANLPLAVAQLAQTSLRNVIGEMDLDETLASRDAINSKLKAILDDATDKWGTKVNRVELKNITPPAEIQVAMEKQMQAERERRAKVLEAEGDMQARIARSKGEKEEEINLANGEKEAVILRAAGQAEAIRLVAKAKSTAIDEIKGSIQDPKLTVQFLVAAQYIDAFKSFETKDGDKVFLPYETTESLGTLGSIKELLNTK